MVSDETLTSLIKDAIKKDERVYLQPINVSVKDGVVTLDGTVRSHRRKMLAYEIASSFEGCRDVINNLKVDTQTPLPDKEILKNVASSLNANADLIEGAINVSVSEGVASLTGTVETDWQRHVADEVARSVKGVRDVNNLLKIDPVVEVFSEELAKGIKAALQDARGLKDCQIGVEISGRTVMLIGVVNSITQKEIAETVARRFGLQDIRNEIIVKPY